MDTSKNRPATMAKAADWLSWRRERDLGAVIVLSEALLRCFGA